MRRCSLFVIMVMKRLVHNMNSRRRYARELSYDAYIEGWDLLSDEGENDPLRTIIEEEIRKEETAQLHRILETFTEKQRFILFQCVVKGRMQILFPVYTNRFLNSFSRVIRPLFALFIKYLTENNKLVQNVPTLAVINDFCFHFHTAIIRVPEAVLQRNGVLS